MYVQTCQSMFLENPNRLLKPGQWIRSHTGLVWHHGIITGFGRDYTTNRPFTLVTHNRKVYGVAETMLQEFSSGSIEIRLEPKSPEHGERVAAFARANWGKPYAAFNQNCEHFASFCYTEGALTESKQVQAFVGVLGLVGIAALAVTSSRA